MHPPSFVLLVADGLTPGALDAAIRAGDVPELGALRHANGLHVVTTVFPSVTGVAYVPMLTGEHPAHVGIPGLRWYDRSRRLPALFGHSRSYVGTQLRQINTDLSPHAPTAFELVNGKALGFAAMITRGLPREAQLDRGIDYTTRVIRAHVAGDVARWAALEAELAEQLIGRVRRERPQFVFAAFTAGDKATHAGGAGAPVALQSLKLVDHVAASIRRDAERDGRWPSMHLCVVSDHGHSPVEQHFDLARAMRDAGLRIRSHPWTLPDRSQVAVMVSGNSMAHVYLDLSARERRPWTSLAAHWEPRLTELLAHPAIDLVATMLNPTTVLVRRGTATAEVIIGHRRLAYRPVDGNPLGLELFEDECDESVHERTLSTAYPDSVRQLARLVPAERSGDIVISASPGWDLRRDYEPINHVSSHGALHASHMLVPLVGSRHFVNTPRQTADVYRSMANALKHGERQAVEPTFAGAPSGR